MVDMARGCMLEFENEKRYEKKQKCLKGSVNRDICQVRKIKAEKLITGKQKRDYKADLTFSRLKR